MGWGRGPQYKWTVKANAKKPRKTFENEIWQHGNVEKSKTEENLKLIFFFFKEKKEN